MLFNHSAPKRLNLNQCYQSVESGESEIRVIIKTSKWGASIGIRLPAAMVEELEIRSGDYLKIDSNERGEIVMWPAKDDVLTPSAKAVESDAEQFKNLTPQQRDKLLMTPPPGW
jgi:antitoxin component of MazEF toxin-antitoxin module